jgi:hypothetical protein
MTESINHPWYGKLWSNLKKFPQFLAEGSKNPPVKSGPAAAALISAGIGCFAMMVTHHISDTHKSFEKIVWSWGYWIPGSNNSDQMWGNIGSYSGKETVMLVSWLISWAILYPFLKDKNIKGTKIILITISLVVAATAMSWHPLFPYLPLM